jgi:predicted RNA polymerase sigma factor
VKPPCRMESVSLAFLQALEALTPTQRAVLLLRDVFDYSAAEVAAALDVSEGNVRIVHYRARRVMEAYSIDLDQAGLIAGVRVIVSSAKLTSLQRMKHTGVEPF